MTVHLVIGVEVDQFGQLVVAQDRVRQQDLVTGLRCGVEQVTLGPDGGLDAGHHFFADGVQWRVGHLGEQLLEVVEQHPGPRRQHRDRGVGAHRAQRLHAGSRHRGDQQVELLVGVAKSLLAQHNPVMRHPDVGALRQVVEVELLGVQPLPVRVGGSQFGLDLLIGDDAALRGVDQEHPARLQPQSLNHGGRVEVEHAGFGRHDHQAVLGDPDPRGPQAVAVQNRADDGAVGETHRGRAVPRFHQRGVVRVEGAAGRVHGLVALPGLGNHHQHRVRQAAPAEVQQFEHLVEAGAVGGAGRADREDLLDVGTEEVGVDQRLAGAHPVLVAGDGVDLTVVGDAAERMRQRPRREGVGGEPRVHDAQRTGDPLVLQIEVESLELRGGEHALVDEGFPGKAGEVDGFATGAVLAGALGAQLVLGALADHIRPALQLHIRGAANEQLTQGGHGVTGQCAQRGVVGGHLAPPQNGQSLARDDLLQRLARGDGLASRLRQEGDTGGVGALGRQLEVDHRAQEGIRNLQQDSGAVTAVRFGAGRAAVFHVQQGGDGLIDDVAAAPAVHIHDHRHAARIVLVGGVIKPDTAGHTHLTLHKNSHRGSNDGATPRRVPPCVGERRPFCGVNRYRNDMQAAPNMPT